MKRKFFAVFVVLLALMLVTCDLFEQPSATKAELPTHTPDGRPMVRFSINLGNKDVSRALTLAQAQANVDGMTKGYYEVAFLNGSDIYRYTYDLAHPDPSGWQVAVPEGLYATANEAVMLAGAEINGEYVLLAIGHITLVEDSDDPTPGYIDFGTSSVTFTLYALKSKVGDMTTPSFEIIGPKSGPNSQDYSSDYSTIGILPDDTDTTIPKFIVPSKGSINSGHTAGTAEKTHDTIGEYTVECSYPLDFDGLVVADDASYTTEEYDNSGVEVRIYPIFPDKGDKVESSGPDEGKFRFFIDVNSSPVNFGLTQMYVRVVVNAIDTAAGAVGTGSPVSWIIQSGVDKTEFDRIETIPYLSEGALFLLELVKAMPSFTIPTVPVSN